jgi:hypothetical protein
MRLHMFSGRRQPQVYPTAAITIPGAQYRCKLDPACLSSSGMMSSELRAFAADHCLVTARCPAPLHALVSLLAQHLGPFLPVLAVAHHLHHCLLILQLQPTPADGSAPLDGAYVPCETKQRDPHVCIKVQCHGTWTTWASCCWSVWQLQHSCTMLGSHLACRCYAGCRR